MPANTNHSPPAAAERDAFSAALGDRRGHPDRPAVQRTDPDWLIAQAVADSEQLPGVFSNPGAGAVHGYADRLTFRDAHRNMRALLDDTGGGLSCRPADEDPDPDGRWAFTVTAPDGRRVAVHMPGLPLECVRFERGQAKALAFPRLYVDGSSWWWPFAVMALADFAAGQQA